MTMTLGWTLLLLCGLVMANLWLLRRNKRRQQESKRAISQRKTADGGVTGSVVASSGTDVSRTKQVDTDHHSPSDGGSDGSGGSD